MLAHTSLPGVTGCHGYINCYNQKKGQDEDKEIRKHSYLLSLPICHVMRRFCPRVNRCTMRDFNSFSFQTKTFPRLNSSIETGNGSCNSLRSVIIIPWEHKYFDIKEQIFRICLFPSMKALFTLHTT